MLPGITPPGVPFSGVVSEVSLSLSSVNSVFLVAASLEVSEMSAEKEGRLDHFEGDTCEMASS